MGEDLKVFRSWSSRFALRAVQALKIKGLDYEEEFEDLTNKSGELLEYNPIHQKVPVLLHKGKPICESLIILEYIDEVWQDPPLLPRDPHDRAMARFWAKFGDEKVCYLPPPSMELLSTLDDGEQVMPSAWSVFISQGKKQEEAIVPFLDNLKFLEEQLKGKKFFGGERIGYLDIALGWMANLISIWEEIIELKLVEADKFPLFSAWMNNFYNHPVIKDCWPPRDKMINRYKARREPYIKKAA